MMAQFADLPEALASTVEIAERCSFRPVSRKPILPRFSLPGARSRRRGERIAQARRAEGLARRIADHGLAEGTTREQYDERLAFELGVIERMNYPGYFLIVADFIQWAKAQGIPVGPGRGSGAGSLVAFALTITDLDPIRFGLIFERFLNPDRVSMPDFDIDFCQNRRDEVIRYVQGRYGRDQVAQIITFGSLQARGVLRDVGRVLEMPYGQVDKLCKLVPQNPAAPVTLSRAIADEPRLQAERDREPVVARAFAIAQKLEGLYRHASTHAAGIVIGDRPLSELVPMYRDPKSDMPVTQFNMKWVEQAGLVKFDFLGLKTLTVLETAVKLVAARGVEINLTRIPLDDAKTFESLARGETVGVFQVESQGMRRALIDMRPDRFEDLIALVALYRPGPMANIPTYCARKLGREPIEFLHPKLEPILAPTYGIITYQEHLPTRRRLHPRPDRAGSAFVPPSSAFAHEAITRPSAATKQGFEIQDYENRFILNLEVQGCSTSPLQLAQNRRVVAFSMAAGISSSRWSMILSGATPSASAWKVVTMLCGGRAWRRAGHQRRRMEPAVERGACLDGQDERLAGPRAGTPRDALPHQLGGLRLVGRLAWTMSPAYWNTCSATGTRRTRCCKPRICSPESVIAGAGDSSPVVRQAIGDLFWRTSFSCVLFEFIRKRAAVVLFP